MIEFDDRHDRVRLRGLLWGIALSIPLWALLCFAAFAQAGAGGPIPNVVGSQYLATPNAVADKQLVPLKVGNDGTLSVTGTTTGTVTGTVQPIPGATGGASGFFLQPTASDNHAVIKAGAGTVYGIVATNNSVTINYLRLYNATTGFDGCNASTNLMTQFAILPSGGASLQFPVGMAFGTGISICVTSQYPTNDATNATASAMSVTVLYK